MRVVFTVALVVAILAVTLPALETVGVDRAATETQGEVERLVQAARSLAAGNDALANESAAARRVVVLDLPQDGLASASLVSLRVGAPTAVPGRSGTDGSDGFGDPRATRISWRVTGGDQQVQQFDGIRLRPASGERFELRGGGTQRIVLRLVSRDGARIVLVSRQRPPE